MNASANSAGPRAKRHRTETLQRRAVLEEQSPWTEGILEYLKVSVTPRKFGQYPGACPLAPVFLKKGSRKFRGQELPDYWEGAKNGDNDVPREYIYMGIAMRPSRTDNVLHDSLGIVCIPTVVQGLADVNVPRGFNLQPGADVYWPSFQAEQGNRSCFIGTFVQRVHETRARIVVRSVGMNLRSMAPNQTDEATDVEED